MSSETSSSTSDSEDWISYNTCRKPMSNSNNHGKCAAKKITPTTTQGSQTILKKNIPPTTTSYNHWSNYRPRTPVVNTYSISVDKPVSQTPTKIPTSGVGYW